MQENIAVHVLRTVDCSNVENLTLLLPHFTEHTYKSREDVFSRTTRVTAEYGTDVHYANYTHVIHVSYLFQKSFFLPD